MIALLHVQASSLLKVEVTFKNESLRIKGLPLIPLSDDITIQDMDKYRRLPAPFNVAPWDTMLDNIIRSPSELKAIASIDFLDDRVWSCYSALKNHYIEIDAAFYELNRLLSESLVSSAQLSVLFAELQNTFQRMKEARKNYDAVYYEMFKYRAENSAPGSE